MGGWRRGARVDRRLGGRVTGFLPSQISGLQLWLRADMGITLASTKVSSWNDQSGSGDANKHQVQGTDASRPIYNSTDAGYNTKPTLSFTSTQFMQATGTWSTAPPRPATIFFVGNGTGGAANGVFFTDDSASAYQFWESGISNAPDTVAMTLSATLFSNTLTDVGAKHIYAVDLNSGSTKIFQDSITANVTGNAGATGGTKIDVVGNGGALTGKVAELIIYDTRLSAANFLAVMTYLSNRYAVTLV